MMFAGYVVINVTGQKLSFVHCRRKEIEVHSIEIVVAGDSIGNFTTGVAQLEPVFQTILSAPTLAELKRIATLDVSDFNYPADVWANTVFEFAASYHKSVISRDHIIQALVPLYRGRALTFLLENRESSGEDVEKNVESLCGEFERRKPYLLEVWADRK